MRKLGILIALLTLLYGNAYAADQWIKTEPAGTQSASDIDALVQANNSGIDRMFANYRQGLECRYNSVSQITIATGAVMCSSSDGSDREMRQNTSATTLTWAGAGDPDGGLDTGAEAASTTYYIYATSDTDVTNAIFYMSTNASTPSGITQWKRIGWFRNDSNSDITAVGNDPGVGSVNQVVGTDSISAGAAAAMTFDSLDNDTNRLYFISSGVRATTFTFDTTIADSGAGGAGYVELKIDGSAKKRVGFNSLAGTGVDQTTVSLTWSEVLTAGERYAEIFWEETGGTVTQDGTTYKRTLTVSEQ